MATTDGSRLVVTHRPRSRLSPTRTRRGWCNPIAAREPQRVRSVPPRKMVAQDEAAGVPRHRVHAFLAHAAPQGDSGIDEATRRFEQQREGPRAPLRPGLLDDVVELVVGRRRHRPLQRDDALAAGRMAKDEAPAIERRDLLGIEMEAVGKGGQALARLPGSHRIARTAPGRLPIPAGRRIEVLLHADAGLVQAADLRLRGDVAPLRRREIPARRLDLVPGDAQAFLVQEGDVELRLRTALNGERQPDPERLVPPACIEGLHACRERPGQTRPHSMPAPLLPARAKSGRTPPKPGWRPDKRPASAFDERRADASVSPGPSGVGGSGGRPGIPSARWWPPRPRSSSRRRSAA